MDRKRKQQIYDYISSQKSFLIAAAGCGKTEFIKDSISLCQGKQLVLSHTNRSISAIRSRLNKDNISSNKYEITTLSSFAWNIVKAYPRTSQVDPEIISNPNVIDGWEGVIKGATKVINKPFMSLVLRATYTHVYVDEYQDCTESHHELVNAINKYLPIHLAGDPLQQLTKNSDDTLVDIEDHSLVDQNFTVFRISDPHRWDKSNPQLGADLAEIRETILGGAQLVPLSKSAIQFTPYKFEENIIQIKAKTTSVAADKHILILTTNDNSINRIASRVFGSYQIDPGMNDKHITRFFYLLDRKLFEEAVELLIRESTTRRKSAPKEAIKLLNKSNYQKYELFDQILLDIINLVFKKPKIFGRVTSPSRLHQAKRVLINHKNLGSSDYSTVYQLDNQKLKQTNQQLHYTLISKPINVKGLEFEHVILIVDKSMKKEDFYVSLTRATESLTIIASTPQIKLTNNQQTNFEQLHLI